MLFTKENVILVERIENWQEAVRLGARPLLNQGKIEEKYIDKMIDSINNLGFYVVLTENIAMPHARPEDGVIESGISFLKINEGVNFGENSIQLIFTLAAKDNTNHIEMLQTLLEIFQDDEKIERLKKALSVEELIKIIN